LDWGRNELAFLRIGRNITSQVGSGWAGQGRAGYGRAGKGRLWQDEATKKLFWLEVVFSTWGRLVFMQSFPEDFASIKRGVLCECQAIWKWIGGGRAWG